MINQLRKLYPNLIVGRVNNNTDKYEWFLLDNKDIIGIPKRELTDKDLHLLSMFLSPYNQMFPTPTSQEQLWEKRIFNNTDEAITSSFRFVFFSLPPNQIEPKLFKEAINELFYKEVSILWESNHEGVLIEERNKNEINEIEYEQIIDILMSDLYVKIQIFIGPIRHNLANVSDHYQNLLRFSKIAYKYTDKNVIHYTDAIPYLITDIIPSTIKQELSQNILKEFIDDHEMIQTIEVFFESNLNISVTAKKLYMHRNSLQYRLDKFYERTGVDVRHFQQALTVYLAILASR